MPVVKLRALAATKGVILEKHFLKGRFVLRDRSSLGQLCQADGRRSWTEAEALGYFKRLPPW